MAELYLCTSRGPAGFEKEVVIKRIRPMFSSDPEFVRMFIAEARLASRLNHANLVQIFDFDKHQDTYYLAMEYVRGRSLADVRKRSKELMIPMRPILVAQVGVEVARGLHCAHQLAENGKPVGLVHRDVSPHNVLLSFDGAVKLTDFGIAKANHTATSPGRLKGKFGYMSPEQSRGEEVDARTDVFTLGVVLWEMLAGGRLFEADGDAAMIRAVQESSIAPPARLNTAVPADLDAVVMRALQRNRKQRFQTAQEMERALAQCVLRHARTLEDTDLGGFLRALYQAPRAIEGQVAVGGAGGGSRAATRRVGSKRQSQSPKRWFLTLPMALKMPARIWVGLSAFLLVGSAVALVGTRLPRGASGGAAAQASWTIPPSAADPSDHPQRAENVVHHPTQNSEVSTSYASPPPTQNSEASPGDAPPAPPSQPVTGTLVLMVTPWAYVEIDGKNRGEVSGLHRYRLVAGKHRLRLWHPRGNREVSITVGANQRVTQQHQMFVR